MALRLCRVGFHRDVKMQVNGSVKTRHRGDEMVLIELGNIESFGKDHWVGIVAKEIGDITTVKSNIDMLNKIGPKDRLEWFKLNFPRADIIKIEAARMIDRLDSQVKDKVNQKDAVTIDSAADLSWK